MAAQETPAERHDNAGEAAASRQAAADGFLSDAGALWRELHGVAHDYLVLITLETKRAGLSLAIILAAGIGIALLLVTAWLGLWAAAVFGLMALGLGPGVSMLIIVAANLGMAAVLYGLIRRRQRDLAFPATVRNLRPSGHTAGEAEQL